MRRSRLGCVCTLGELVVTIALQFSRQGGVVLHFISPSSRFYLAIPSQYCTCVYVVH